MLACRGKRMAGIVDELFNGGEWNSPLDFVPKTMNWNYGANVYSLGEKLFVELEMAGYSKGDITVSFEEEALCVKASKKEKEDKDIVWYNKGFVNKEVEKTISIPVEIEEDSINAQLEDGILTVVMDLKKKEVPKKIKIS